MLDEVRGRIERLPEFKQYAAKLMASIAGVLTEEKLPLPSVTEQTQGDLTPP